MNKNFKVILKYLELHPTFLIYLFGFELFPNLPHLKIVKKRIELPIPMM
jgi:hypothetical protein